jgi:hypothetical protein
MNEKECSRSVPIRYVPLHRKDRYWHIQNVGIHTENFEKPRISQDP